MDIQTTNIMANRKVESLNMDNADESKVWLIAFEARCRTKKLNDKIDGGTTSPQTDAFLESCGAKALLKLITLMPGKEIQKEKFSDIKKTIERYTAPKTRLEIADRTTFLEMQQDDGETVVDFLSRLNDMATHCKWGNIEKENMCDEMVKLRFIAGLSDNQLKLKVLEKLQIAPTSTINDIVDFCQMNQQLCTFVSGGDNNNTTTVEANYHSNSKPTHRSGGHTFRCKKCGTKHMPRKCPAFGRTCAKCKLPNHYASCCRTPKSAYKQQQQHSISDAKQQETTDSDNNSIETFNINKHSSSGIMQEVTVNDQQLSFQLDTGAAMSIMSEKQWKQIGHPTVQHTDMQPTNYDGSRIATIGELTADVMMNNTHRTATFIVVKSNKDYGLIGRNIIDSSNTQIATYAVTEEYLPAIKGYSASITLSDVSKPLKFCKARNVPIMAKDDLDKELEDLEKQGIITPIENAKHCSPVVWTPKSNGRYRLTVDYRATLNSNIETDSYPLPTAEEVFGRVGNATRFAKVDLQSAYWQIELDEEAKKLAIINTHRGLYKMHRLQMGMKNSSAIFQRCMETMLKGLPGIIVYQDDVMVFAESRTQLKKRVKQLYEKLREHNVTVNKEKCEFDVESLKFLGYMFTKDGIKPNPELTSKIADAQKPKNLKELASFLGLVTFYGRFIPRFAQICVPLNNAKKSEKLVWNDQCEQAFNTLKEKITSSPVLQPFDIKKKSTLTVDASQQALGAVLQQNEHPVLFVSRKLTDTESRYSNIEREGLAVIWACERLSHFLLGKKFEIETDHKPLVHIFDPTKQISTDVSSRLQKYNMKLMRFDYDIKHVAGKNNVIADSLSRVYHTQSDEVKMPQVNFSEPCIDKTLLAKETKNDRFLQDLTKRIVSGDWSNVSKKEKPFKKLALQLTIDDQECVRLRSRIIPPQSMYKNIFDIAHQSHCGMQATLRLIENEFYWPGMRNTVENFVKSCDVCAKARFQSKDNTHTWSKEEKPWSRVHIDWAYQKNVGNILVVADAYSGWLEAKICDRRTTQIVIRKLRSIFATFGVPHVVVSDNAPEFSCHEFKQWLNNIGCRLMHSPEYRPSSNGLAERNVKTIKDALKCYNPAKGSAQKFLQRFLFVHRNTAVRNSKTPAELNIGRRVRCPILTEYNPMQEVLYKPNKSAKPKPVVYLFKRGQNTAMVAEPGRQAVVAHDAQIAPQPERPVRNRKLTEFYGEYVTH